MHVRYLSLTNFRLYARLELDLPRGVIVIEGDNAQGKTSLLEALYLLATARSPHTATERQVIRWGVEAEEPFPFALLRAGLQRDDGLHVVEMLIQKSEGERLRKEIRVDRNPCRASDLLGWMRVVLFLPGDVELVAGPPALRREFLDLALAQVSREYARALEQYQRVLAQRNAFLRQAAEQGRSPDLDALAVLDDQLVPPGVTIALHRRAAIADFNQLASPIHRELSGGSETLQVVYQPNFDPARPPLERAYQLGLDESAPPEGLSRAELTEAFQRALHRRRKDELMRGMTLVGPHRDEVRFLNDGVDLGEFGSRGQQRTAVLAMKLAQAEWVEHQTGEMPVLLLDEVLAELDPNRRRSLLRRVARCEQAIITTTDIYRLDEALRHEAKVLRARGGVVR